MTEKTEAELFVEQVLRRAEDRHLTLKQAREQLRQEAEQDSIQATLKAAHGSKVKPSEKPKPKTTRKK